MVNSVQGVTKRAIRALLVKDQDLLALQANERSISHKLAEYLRKEIGEEYDVDCEYNRLG